jgi:uncharacterized lipoprotein YmbA
MTRFVFAAAMLGAATFAGAACLPSPKPVTVNYVILAGRAPGAPPGNPSGTLGISRVSLPGYLDRGEVATRTGTKVTYSATERWAEPLAESVPRLLADDLATALAPSGFAVAPHAAGDLALVVDVERFELDGNGSCVLDARYALRDVMTDRIVKTGAGRYEERPSGPTGDAAAAALARALDRLAGDVVSGVGEVRATTAR